MNRMKSYEAPHKGLRNALSQLSLLAGQTDGADVREVQALCLLAKDVFCVLHTHAADEDDVTLAALEARCPGASDHDKEDHEHIHESQKELEESLERIAAASEAGENVSAGIQEFYLTFTEFHSLYLEHTAEEERITQVLLWEHFTDEELSEHRKEIMSALHPEVLKIWLRFIVPALSQADRISFMKGFKMMAPESFFCEVMDMLSTEIPSGKFHELKTELG